MAHGATPMIGYEDVEKAVIWLSRAFGFRERGERFMDDQGRVTHAELDVDGGRVMLGWPGSDYQSPAHHATVCDTAARWLSVPWVVDGVFVMVDDVESHHARAVAAGAAILRDPEKTPVGTLYTASDHEGHRWMFMEPDDRAGPADGVIQR
jgi:uncharacterized glyoxalase superfamily protein PhnB